VGRLLGRRWISSEYAVKEEEKSRAPVSRGRRSTKPVGKQGKENYLPHTQGGKIRLSG